MTAAGDLATRLPGFLQAQMPDARDIRIAGLTPVSGGNARRAWSFDAGWTEGGGRKEVGCIMLCKAEAGQLETDLVPEFRTLAALDSTDVPAPRALWLDADGRWLGSPGFVMNRVEGLSDIVALLHPENPAASRAVAEHLADATARLHAVDWRARGVDFLPIPAPESVAREQVAYWRDLYLRHRMEPLPVMAHAFRWLSDHAPAAERIVLVHGDMRFGNFLYRGAEITALLDWEMAHLGDPAEDVAWIYHPLWSPEPHLPLADFVARYRAAGGAPIAPETLLFYRLFGLVKHSVISLTGARSWRDGRTRNLRMADRMTLVTDCLIDFLDWLPDEAPTEAAA
jgi:aminoglycoside phosphotransferase (APT) family kinase protein